MGGDRLYFLTLRELSSVVTQHKVLATATRRQEIYLEEGGRYTKADDSEVEAQNPPAVVGLCIANGKVKGTALVLDSPVPNIELSITNDDILITKKLHSNFAWLPLMRLFKGIVLESSGYLELGTFHISFGVNSFTLTRIISFQMLPYAG